MAKYRDGIQEWIENWEESGLASLWELGHVVKNDLGNATTPVESLICQLGESYY